ncbi:acetyltransferase [Metabacillus iocasae]|uniref:Sugar O-acyltransferase (Sialic acid O-acetyltransferase NeuD family) n=1 Tax=Priestia iocasae TaxID=2291674 RepID=A0ABS2QV01_9BACI|nr:acetyltransferase [Metabacillus iocasae]MBM7703023.1 sugar O-acyltransferase (sialic acid O-acetyltransferase NeuD family) [Metabacillus iocasae]
MKWGVVGTGGHSKVVVEAIQTVTPDASFVFFSQVLPAHSFFSLYTTLIDEEEVINSYKHEIEAWHVAIGQIDVREQKLTHLIEDKHNTPIVMHETATVSRSSIIEKGTFINAGAIVNACACIGQGTIINTGSTIDHDCIIGDYVNVGPGSHLAGGVIIGQKTDIGTGVSIRPNIQVGRECVIGAGSVVVSDIPDYSVVYGVPAKVIKIRS